MQPGPSISPGASALEHLPHLARKLCDLWGKDAFEDEVNQVIMDSRDGQRQGLPREVMDELLFLLELVIAKRALHAAESTGMPFREAFRQHLEKAHKFAQHAGEDFDPWSNPRDRGQAGGVKSAQTSKAPAPARRARTQTKKSWWRRLFG
jgi:hypothetical protein